VKTGEKRKKVVLPMPASEQKKAAALPTGRRKGEEKGAPGFGVGMKNRGKLSIIPFGKNTPHKKRKAESDSAPKNCIG